VGTLSFKYNPGVLGDSELVRSFVVRHKCLHLILEALKENAESASANRHLLVVGPRGIGKTMLVRRVAAEVRTNPEYGRTWFPIVYGEESYQVSTSGEFWLEALFHLSENAAMPNMDRTLHELREETNDARLRERALAQLLDFADSKSRRLLFVVENLNMLCEQITPEAAWELRHTLTNEPRIMLLGTATSRFEAITHAGQAWFELFAVQELKPLDRTESHILWQSLAQQDLKPGHVRALRILTGGNPRLLTVLAGFAGNHSFRDLMEQLIHLIDDHTEYFKGHLDALPVKERKVFVALLEQWNPVSAAEVARGARMGVNEVSASLARLVARGAVELYEQKPRRKLYQAAERLYNIYYLMRRRGQPSDRVRAAVSFMVMFYGGRQLATTIAELAREACGLPAGKTEDHFEAYAELARYASPEIWARALKETPPEFFNRPDAPESVRKLPKASKLGTLLKRANQMYQARQWVEAAQAYREVIKLEQNTPSLWGNLGFVLLQMGHLDEAERAVQKSIELNPKLAPPWHRLGTILTEQGRVEEAEQAFRKAIELDPLYPCAWNGLGYLLGTLKRYDEAEQACRRAIEIDPAHVAAWVDLGIVFSRRGQLEDAEQSYRKAIELDPKRDTVWANLGTVLRKLKRYEEAKRAYQTAIDLSPDQPNAWDGLGHLLSEAGPPSEAERVWREAIRRHPSLGRCAAHVLEAQLAQGVAREVILREAEEWINRVGRTTRSLDSMARFVLWSKLTEGLPQAEVWAREGTAASSSPGTVLETLPLVLAAQNKWKEAVQASRPVMDAAAEYKEAQKGITEFLIQAAAAGYAREALDLLQSSKGAVALEPLLVGLRIYLGEAPQVAKEILEIGKDVAERIRHVSLSNKPVVRP
jgi:tetratricopeptide (TPR) repeat protein